MLKFEYPEFGGEQTIIPDIIGNKISGAVLNDALSDADCQAIHAIIRELTDRYFTDLNEQNGYSLPSMFGQLHKSLPYNLANKYFDEVETFKLSVNSIYRADFGEKLISPLKKAFQPMDMAVLSGFLPYSFRIVYPGKLGLSLHRDGDLLPYIHQDVAKRIASQIQVNTLMSWFFTIQQPEKGGELWVGDSCYNTYYKKGEMLIAEDGRMISPAEIPHMTVPTEKGSLLVFKGGSYWHMVLPPGPNLNERITLGGFMALSLAGNSLLIWS
jgi:hypothetical protein